MAGSAESSSDGIKVAFTPICIFSLWRCLMSLERICSKDVVTISPEANVLEAAKLMHSKHVGCLVVTDDFRPIGILTDRDIVLKLVASEQKPAEIAVKKIMTTNPTMVNVNYDVLDAVRLMRTRGVRRLPIVDEHQRLFGIMTMDDVLAAFGMEAGDLAGVVQKEFNLEAAAFAGSSLNCMNPEGGDYEQ
jgi:CBS domain-containing protein